MRRDFNFELTGKAKTYNNQFRPLMLVVGLFVVIAVYSLINVSVLVGGIFGVIAGLILSLNLYRANELPELVEEQRDDAYLEWIKTRSVEEMQDSRKKILLDLALYFGNELAEDPNGEGTSFDRDVIDALAKVRKKYIEDKWAIAYSAEDILKEENLLA